MRLPLAPEDDPVIVIEGDESLVGVSDPLYSCDNCEVKRTCITCTCIIYRSL